MFFVVSHAEVCALFILKINNILFICIYKYFLIIACFVIRDFIFGPNIPCMLIGVCYFIRCYLFSFVVVIVLLLHLLLGVPHLVLTLFLFHNHFQCFIIKINLFTYHFLTLIIRLGCTILCNIRSVAPCLQIIIISLTCIVY